MTIAIVGPYPLSPDCIRGGVESSVFGLARELCLCDIVDIFDHPRIGGSDTVLRVADLTIHRYANRGRHNRDALTRANEVLRDIIAIHPDIVHIHGTDGYSAYLYHSVKQYGIKTLLTVHGLAHVEKRNLLLRHPTLKHLYQFINQSRTEFRLLNNADHIIVDTEYVANQIKRYHRQGRIRRLPWIYVIPQGINEDFLCLTPAPDSGTILSVGAISRRKGHLLLLQAFEQLCTTCPSAQLIISGSLADPDYYADIRYYIFHSPYKNRISLLTNLSQNDLLNLYTRATIFALHSQEESQGIALVEAMAARLPVVATNVGGIPYVVRHGECGLLSDYGDISAFAANLQTLLSQPALLTTMATAAHTEAAHYSWSQIADAIRLVYNRL